MQTILLNSIAELNKDYSIAILIICLGIAIGVIYSIGMLIKDYLDDLDDIANRCEKCGGQNRHECEYYGCHNSNEQL